MRRTNNNDKRTDYVYTTRPTLELLKKHLPSKRKTDDSAFSVIEQQKSCITTDVTTDSFKIVTIIENGETDQEESYGQNTWSCEDKYVESSAQIERASSERRRENYAFDNLIVLCLGRAFDKITHLQRIPTFDRVLCSPPAPFKAQRSQSNPAIMDGVESCLLIFTCNRISYYCTMYQVIYIRSMEFEECCSSAHALLCMQQALPTSPQI